MSKGFGEIQFKVRYLIESKDQNRISTLCPHTFVFFFVLLVSRFHSYQAINLTTTLRPKYLNTCIILYYFSLFYYFTGISSRLWYFKLYMPIYCQSRHDDILTYTSDFRRNFLLFFYPPEAL